MKNFLAISLLLFSSATASYEPDDPGPYVTVESVSQNGTPCKSTPGNVFHTSCIGTGFFTYTLKGHEGLYWSLIYFPVSVTAPRYYFYEEN